MKRKVFIPFVALMLAFVMIFAVACGNNVGNTVKTYTITYYLNGSVYATQTYNEGNLLVPVGAPNVEGYEFEGWNTSEDGTGDALVEGTAVTADATYYAVLKSTSSGNNPGTDPDDNPGGEVTTYTVTFIVDDEVFDIQEVESGKTVTPPTPPERDGEMFVGWYESVAMANAYDFTKPVTSNLTLTARYAELSEGVASAGAYNESLYVVWGEADPANTTVEYVAAGENNWAKVDAPLVRAISDTEARVDILGLAAGSYNVRITTSTGDAIQLPAPLSVTAYDRSGYAHFNYTDGVGAYNDDGTLKDNALVIYVTDGNKNNVLDSAYVNGQKVDISQYMAATTAADGVTVGQQKGIGELLNNRRYSGNDRWNVGISKLSEVFGAVAIRIIGTVSAEVSGTMESSINGLTDYSSTGNGGSVGDNGRMARMVNAHDLTVEGVGDDASIYGWGVHFISSESSGKTARMGKSFEVRNLIFENYPEDAIGMEGEQASKKSTALISSPVERCWIHNNTFLPGYASSPAESDKGEGDGSCDFKRGMYYTNSYNYYESCHKTNLVGSASYSLQFNITFHHNWWNNCQSRQPLARHANIHFYNNYISGTTDTVSSMRAMSYMYSEANYYNTCTRPVEYKSEDGGTGIVKSFNDVFLNCTKDNSSTKVDTRDQYVDNNCVYSAANINYSHFDTYPTLFYYDATNNVSDCLLETAVEARKTVIKTAGANGHGAGLATNMNDYTPTSAVTINASGDTVINLPTAKNDTEVNGVLFRGLTGTSSGTIKFKGQGITFTLAAEAEITVSGTASAADNYPELVRADGTVMAAKFNGTIRLVLPAGTYFITSGVGLLAGKNAKESTISELKFADTGESSAARVQSAIDAINAIPATAELTDGYAELISAARTAYNALTAAEKAAFDSAVYAKLEAAESAYGQLLIAQFKELVAAIGTVNENSYDKINAAQVAYDKLTSAQKAQVATEKATLDAAWAAFEEFEVLNVINMIDAFATKVEAVGDNTERATIEALIDEGENVQDAYNKLADDSEDGPSQQAQVTNYAKLTEAIAKLQTINNLFIFINRLEAFAGHTVTMSDAADVSNLQKAYGALTEAQLNKLTEAQKAEYNRIVTEFENVMSVTITSDFSNSGQASDTTGTFVASGSQKSEAHTVKGVEYKKGLKVDSKATLTINVTVKSILTLYVINGNYLTLDGVATESPVASAEADTDCYVITLELEAGMHTITRGKSENSIYYAILSPAA